MQEKSKTCCFTGHRTNTHNFFPNAKAVSLIKQKLGEEIDSAIRQGYTHFICGNAEGVDTWAAQLVIERKRTNTFLTLEIAVPYRGHNNNLSPSDMRKQRLIHQNADIVSVISEKEHIKAYEERDRYMVDNSTLVIAVFDADEDYPSGTKRTVEYAKRSNKKVVIIPWMEICAKVNLSQKQPHKNIYVHYESEGFQYRLVEAVDDFGHTFSFKFTHADHEEYLQEAQKLCEAFEKYCKETCGFRQSRCDDIWFVGSTSVLPPDFCYESLFAPETVRDVALYEKNSKIRRDYQEKDLELMLGSAEWCCVCSLEFEYAIKTTHLKKPLSFNSFVKQYSRGEVGAKAVRNVVSAYKRLIDKKDFNRREVENISAYVKSNLQEHYCYMVTHRYNRKRAHSAKDRLNTDRFSVALARLYRSERTLFAKYITQLLDALDTHRHQIDNDIYNIFESIRYECYEQEDFVGYQDGPLSSEKLIKTFGPSNLVKRICEMVQRTEG